jgi:hypothetical protein
LLRFFALSVNKQKAKVNSSTRRPTSCQFLPADREGKGKGGTSNEVMKPIFTLMVAVVALPAMAQPSVLLTSPAQVAPGGLITVTVSGGPATPTDWVALTGVSEPDNGYADWKYLNGSQVAPTLGIATSSVSFTAPAAGTYNVRFYGNNRLSNKLATSASVVVSSSATAPPVQPPPGPEQKWFRFCLDDGVTCYEGMLTRTSGGGW